MREGDLTGRTLADRYDILELLGSGGMGAVYRAHDRELDELVALKVVRGDRATPAVLEQFRREVKLARRVTHTNVARTFELVTFEGITFCTMELIEGESLRARLERERTLVPVEAVAVALAVCDALVAAHRVGVIHRDIKPDNILIDQDGRVVLADFGVAAVTVAEGGGMSGTLEYMAPEQARGEPPTPATDVYAVGLVLYEMLTGLRAFAGTVSELIVAKQDVERVTFELAELLAPGAVSPELVEIVGNATARDPGRRIATAAELGRALATQAGVRRHRTQLEAPPAEQRRAIRTVIVLAPRALRDERVHLAEGVHEALLRELVAVPQVRVWPRVTPGEVPPDAVVVALDAGERLEVAVRRGATEVQHVLPLAIERVPSAAATIACAVVDLLDREGPGDAERAAEMVLRARRLVHARGFGGAEAAIELLERAHALYPDPRTAAIHAMIYVRFSFTRGRVDVERNRALVAAALAAAPDLVETHVAAGLFELHTGDPTLAAAHYRTAIACSPYVAEGHEALGRMLLEAGFLDDAMRRLTDALAITPDLNNVRWEIARAHALEQNWLLYDQLMAQLRADDIPFLRMRFAWWRGNFDEIRAIRDHLAGRTDRFEAPLIDRLIDVALEGRWPEHRDALMARALDGSSSSRRRTAFVAQLVADGAGYAGDVAACLSAITHATSFGLYDLHWLEKCPFLGDVRATPRGAQLVAQVRDRAHAILDALYGDRGPTDTIATDVVVG